MQNFDFPEAETMETRKVNRSDEFWYGMFVGIALATVSWMFYMNYVIGQLSPVKV